MRLIAITNEEKVTSQFFVSVEPNFKQVILQKVRDYYKASFMVSEAKKDLGEAPGRGLERSRYTL